MADESVKLTIRIPADLHAALAELAKLDVRSLNAEIAVLLREAVERRRAAAPRAQ